MLVLIFVRNSKGDFGNENVELVRTIADLQMTKAVILGNHDAWNTEKFSGGEKDAVQLQLECLGDDHVGYRRMDYPALNLSVVGGRPFSCGGEQIYRKRLLKARYGISDMDQSSMRIVHAAQGTPDNHSVIFLAHNSPTGTFSIATTRREVCSGAWSRYCQIHRGFSKESWPDHCNRFHRRFHREVAYVAHPTTDVFIKFPSYKREP